MQVLVKKSDMTVVDVFPDTTQILMEKTMVIAMGRYNIAGVDVDTAILYRGVKVVPSGQVAGKYFFNGKMFMKNPNFVEPPPPPLP